MLLVTWMLKRQGNKRFYTRVIRKHGVANGKKDNGAE
jgi:hypothetical protein